MLNELSMRILMDSTNETNVEKMEMFLVTMCARTSFLDVHLLLEPGTSGAFNSRTDPISHHLSSPLTVLPDL